MNEIRESILNKLEETQNKYNVRILLAIESGSRGWGFASPDSDYDCRFIYVHERDWYLSVLDKKDIIEYAADEIYDINGWDLKKVLQHLMKSNAVMHEWLYSNMVYIRNEEITGILRDMAKQYFNPIASSYHYLSMAINKYNEIQVEEESKLKKYFYTLRPLANVLYIKEHMKIPYMEYEHNLNEIEVRHEIREEIDKLLEIKKVSDESYKIPKNTILMDYFKEVIEATEENLKEMKFTKNKDYSDIDIAFKKIIDLAWLND